MEKIINITKFVFITLFYLILSAVVASIVKKLNIHNPNIKSIVLLSGEAIIFLIFILIFRKELKKDFGIFKKLTRKDISNILLIWLLGVVFMIVSNTILTNILGDIANNESLNRKTLEKYTLYAIPSMVIIAPFIEELIFRLSVKKFINNKYIYIITSGLLFGLAHVIGVKGLEYLYIIPYGMLGSCFAYIYQKNNTIFSSIMVHMIHNGICILLLLFI